MVGLSRLSEANSLVGTMQEELVALGPKIEEKARVSQSFETYTVKPLISAPPLEQGPIPE